MCVPMGVNSRVLARRTRQSRTPGPHRPAGLGVLPEEATSVILEGNREFHCVTWLGCMSKRSASIASAFRAAKAGFALKAGRSLPRVLQIISASGPTRHLPLPKQRPPVIRLSGSPRPSQCSVRA